MKSIKKIVLIVIIILIGFQPILLAANLTSTNTTYPRAPLPTELDPEIYSEDPSSVNTRARIIGTMIDLFQLLISMIIIIFIIFYIHLYINKRINLAKAQKNLEANTPSKINFDQLIHKEIKNAGIKYSNLYLFLLFMLSIIIIFILSILLSMVFIPLSENSNIISYIGIIVFYLLAFFIYMRIFFLSFSKKIKKIDQIINSIVYNNNNIQNKEYYYAKESLRYVKKHFLLVLFILFLWWSTIAINNVLNSFAKSII